MESAVIVAIITGVVTIVNTIISKKTSKKVDNISNLREEITKMREESRKEMQEHLLDSDKTYLINFLSEIEHAVPKTDIQVKRAYEIYERYCNNGGNSYVHDKWEKLMTKDI